jgi:tellurite resistance protein TerC
MTIFWVGFNLFVLAMLALDLGVFHRKSHEVKIKEALIWSGVWVFLALCLNAGIYFQFGKVKALEFLTGYLIEKSLSIDNVFVFILIFSYFKVEPRYQHKVLFWGILGALVMRIALILLGIELLNRFHWVIYIFGLLLIITGIKMALEKGKEIHPEKNPVLRLFKKIMPVANENTDGKFLTRLYGKVAATPLLVVLIVVETTDLIFAVDSIPAILAISRDTFIVYTSNVMAILGLRALYFALAGVMTMFHYLHYGLSAILVFVGAKMMITEFYKIPILVSLTVISSILVISILASLWKPLPAAKSSN